MSVQTGIGLRSRGASLRTQLGTTGALAAAFLLVVLTVAVLAPVVAPHDPDVGDLLQAYAGPDASHWLGTDATGRDIASRLVFGARTSLVGPLLIVLMAMAISIPVALVSAWRGGWVAAVVDRVVDVLFSIPGLLLAILAAAIFGAGLAAATVALAIAYVPYTARLVVAAARSQRLQPYVRVLTVQGIAPRRIMVSHVLRNVAPLLVGQATITFAYALIDLAALSFLGLGVQAPRSDWGAMISDRDAVLQGHPQQAVMASVAVVLTVLSLLVVGSRLSGESPRGPLSLSTKKGLT